MSKVNRDWEKEFEGAESNNKDFLEFFHKILRNWYWFVICGAIGVSLAFIYLKSTVPAYLIHAKLLVSDDKKGGGMVSSSALGDLSGLMGAKNSVDNEVEVLKTADLMRAMVIAEKAYVGYFEKERILTLPVASIPYTVSVISSPDKILESISFKIKSVNGNQLEVSNPDTIFVVGLNKPFFIEKVGDVLITESGKSKEESKSYVFTIQPVYKVVNDFMDALSVEVTNKMVSTIDLTFATFIPRQGEQFLGTLIEKYVELNLHDKNVIADSTLSFINARLTRITDELAGVEDRISGYKRSTQLADISEQSRLLLQNSAEYTKSIAEVETQLAVVDAMVEYLNDAKNPRVVPSSVIPQDVAFNSLVSQYNELVLQRERLLLANTEDNPLVKNISSQIAGVRQDMIQNVSATRRNLELSQSSQRQLAKSMTSQIQRVPTIERGYIDLARLQQIKQAQYIFLQEKWEETAISRTANVSNSKVIDSPKSEEFSFAPKKNTTMIIGLFLGLLIPLIVLYVRNLLNIRVQTLQDVKNLTDLPVLGTISHSDNHEQVVISPVSRSPIAEQFRAMRTNLEFALNGGKIILFTSSMSGEGKSYVALNLAVSLALLDKKVLLMELDLRKPSITSKLGLPAGKGFSHYVVRQDMRVEEIIMPSGAHENVDLIQAGAIPPNPAELLLHSRTDILMKELKNQYDFILMDAPPVGIVTDAQLLSRYSDLCLYLVRQRYTYKEQLNIPNDLNVNHKINPIQLVVNDIHAKGGYYSGYGYGYGYGDYGQEPSKRKWWKIFRK